jgi:hypothetical protein
VYFGGYQVKFHYILISFWLVDIKLLLGNVPLFFFFFFGGGGGGGDGM